MEGAKVSVSAKGPQKPSETSKIGLGGWGLIFEKIALWASSGVL